MWTVWTVCLCVSGCCVCVWSGLVACVESWGQERKWRRTTGKAPPTGVGFLWFWCWTESELLLSFTRPLVELVCGETGERSAAAIQHGRRSLVGLFFCTIQQQLQQSMMQTSASLWWWWWWCCCCCSRQSTGRRFPSHQLSKKRSHHFRSTGPRWEWEAVQKRCP